jgi:HAE1 family hydrophobic/amphiphilic exporter-1
MTITEISIKRPILILVFIVALALIGVYSFFQLNYELLPDITPPHVSVITKHHFPNRLKMLLRMLKK